MMLVDWSSCVLLASIETICRIVYTHRKLTLGTSGVDVDRGGAGLYPDLRFD